MNYKRLTFRLLYIIPGAVLALWLAYKFQVWKDLSPSSINEYINSFGHFAVIAYILIFTLRTFLIIFPYSVMVVLGGSIFGAFKGFIYTMIAVFFSASAAFFSSRFLGKEFIQRRIGHRVEKLNLKTEKHGFKIILLMRISVVFPYDILNFAAGLTKIRYRDFILGTLIGIFPETFSFAFFGHNLHHPFSTRFYISVLLVVLTATVPFVYNKINGKNSEDNE